MLYLELLKKISEQTFIGFKDHFSKDFNIKTLYHDNEANYLFENNDDRMILEIISEPGRFFVQSSHTLLVNVIGRKIKTTRMVNENNSQDEYKKTYCYNMNDGIYGSFNCIYFDHKKPIVLPFNERNENKLYKSKIFGPTCDSIDLITNEIMLPELAIGEWVYVENFGAYTTAASSSFNGFITTDYKYILRN